MFISIRSNGHKVSPSPGPDIEFEPTSTMSTRERLMKRSSKGWAKKTQVMEGFAFTIKAQAAGEKGFPLTYPWKPLGASPDEPSKKIDDADQSGPSSYFLESNPDGRDATIETSLNSIRLNRNSTQDFRGVLNDLKGWISRKSKSEVSGPLAEKPRNTGTVLGAIESAKETKPTSSLAARSNVQTDLVPVYGRKRPRHPPRRQELSERPDGSWIELWKAAKAGIARESAVVPTIHIAPNTCLRQQITIRGSPLRQSHIVTIVKSGGGDIEADNAAPVQEAMLSIEHHFDLPHFHKKRFRCKRSLADQVTRHEFRQNTIGQCSRNARAPVRTRAKMFIGCD